MSMIAANSFMTNIQCECCGNVKIGDTNILCQPCYKEIDNDMSGAYYELFFLNREGDAYDV